MVRISGHSTSTTTVTLRHEDSGTLLGTVAPKDNGGDGSAFSPTDLCAASLGACAVTIMNLFARRNEIEVRGISFTLEKTMASAPRRIAALTVHYVIDSDCSEEQLQRLTAAARACPVRNSLHPDVNVEETFTRGKVVPQPHT